MAKYDLESALADLKAFLLANLNLQIAAVNAEKNDSIALGEVEDSAYHLQFLQDRTELANPLLLYGETEPATIDMQGGTAASVHRIGVFIILSETGLGDDTIVQRLFRYRRVLMDLLQAYWSTAIRENKLRLVAIPPVGPTEKLNSGFQGRFTGVEFALTIVG